QRRQTLYPAAQVRVEDTERRRMPRVAQPSKSSDVCVDTQELGQGRAQVPTFGYASDVRHACQPAVYPVHEGTQGQHAAAQRHGVLRQQRRITQLARGAREELQQLFLAYFLCQTSVEGRHRLDQHAARVDGRMPGEAVDDTQRVQDAVEQHIGPVVFRGQEPESFERIGRG